MRIIAHRGFHRSLPENSLASFEAAVKLGADGVELDVRLTRDGVPVVVHDLECEHSLDGVSGYVFEHDLAELRRVPLRGSAPDRVQLIPTLAEVLEAFAGRLLLEVELKDPTRRLVEEVARVLVAVRPRWGSIEVTSFEGAALSALSLALPAPIATCRLVQRSEPWMTPPILAHLAVGKAELSGARAVHLHATQLNEGVTAALQRAGVEVHAWEVNDETTFELARRTGATSIDTDEPERMLELRTRSG